MLIGLHGKMACGKDTAFKYIQDWAESEGHLVARDAFADRLKLSAARLFHPRIDLPQAVTWCNTIKQPGYFVSVTSDRDLEVTEITGREFLQAYGTEAHRDVFGQAFWVEAVFADYNPSALLVITDVRFANEAAAIHDRVGQVWHIVRPSADNDDAHPSERPLPSRAIDHTIVNDGSLEDFRRAVVLRLESEVCV